MRLKVVLGSEHLSLPINYQHILQGLIYSAFDQKKYGAFIHDKGYQLDNKKFKFFVFSNLFGDYKVENNIINFDGDVYFYVSSYNLDFINKLYEYLRNNPHLSLSRNKVEVKDIEVLNLDYFDDYKIVTLHALSPIVAYITRDKYVNYFKPSSDLFEQLCINNLDDKNMALDNPFDEIYFKILNVSNEKKRLVNFKNSFYVSYLCDIKVKVNYYALKLIYDTGLSSKGSAGFGMMEIK